MEHIGLAFLLTLFAGLSTGIGSAIAFFAKKTNTRFLAISLGFSAGVMIYISFVEILVDAREILQEEMG
ncbi:MAG: zinc transporter ZupT, partial [Clostridia bacterium]|nr:zinc transporter ZupT [Clostridia bacterium]